MVFKENQERILKMRFFLMSEIPIACAVCFGDPNSSMTKGAAAGMLCLFGVVLFVLAGIAATGIVWARRARAIPDDKY